MDSVQWSVTKEDCLILSLFLVFLYLFLLSGDKNGTVGGLYIRNTRIGGPSPCHTRHARYSGTSGFSLLVVSDFANMFTLSVSRTYKADPPKPLFSVLTYKTVPWCIE